MSGAGKEPGGTVPFCDVKARSIDAEAGRISEPGRKGFGVLFPTTFGVFVDGEARLEMAVVDAELRAEAVVERELWADDVVELWKGIDDDELRPECVDGVDDDKLRLPCVDGVDGDELRLPCVDGVDGDCVVVDTAAGTIRTAI